MISRRNIRIKVMQCLSAAESESTASSEMSSLKLLKSYLDQTAELFAFCIFSLTEIARYAETDAKLRSSKHLPSYEDLHVNIKIAGNSLPTRQNRIFSKCHVIDLWYKRPVPSPIADYYSVMGLMRSPADSKIAIMEKQKYIGQIFQKCCCFCLYPPAPTRYYLLYCHEKQFRQNARIDFQSSGNPR